MENITRAAFDVQYGLFKVSLIHFLYQLKIIASLCIRSWYGKIQEHKCAIYVLHVV